MTAFHVAARSAGVALLLAGAMVLGQTAAPVTAVAPARAKTAKAIKAFKLLNEADLRPAVLLPPPPPAGSPAAVIDLAEVRRTVAAETPEELAQAQSDDEHEDPSIFDAVIGGGFEARKLPATWAFLTLVEHEGGVAASSAKQYFHRAHPWSVDPAVRRCGALKPGVAAQSTSYPSGHATLGYSVGLVLATLLPAKAGVIQARANEYADHRIVCGVHYRTDIEGGHVVGVVVGTRLLTSPATQAMIAAARAELLQAQFTGN